MTLSLLAHCGDPLQPGGVANNRTFDYRNLPQLVGSLQLAGGGRDFDIDGDTALIPLGGYGFSIVDLSNRRAPKYRHHVEWDESVVAIFQESPTLYVLDRSALHLLDSATPMEPPRSSLTFPEGSYPIRMFLGKSCIIALDAAADHLLWFVDVSDPNQPRKVAEVPVGGRVTDMAVDGDLLLVGTEHGVVFLDIADLNNVETLSSIGQGRYVAAANGFAYVNSRSNYWSSSGLTILNIQDPRHPQEIASLGVPSGAGPMVLQGNRLFVRVYDHVDVINVLDRQQPKREGSIFSPGDGGLHLRDSRLWTASNHLQEYDVGETIRAPVLGERGVRAWWGWAQLEQGRLFARDPRGLFALDVTDPQLPTPPRALPSDYEASVSHVDGQRLYLRRDNHIYIHNLETAQLQGSISLENTIQWLTVAGDYLYVLARAYIGSHYELRLVDVSNVSKPQIVGGVTREGDPFVHIGVAQLVADKLYVLVDTGLDIFDVSRPHRPQFLSHQAIQHPERMTLYDGFVYITTRNTNLITVDVCQAAQPRVVSDQVMESLATDLVAEGNFLYMTTTEALKVYDISHRAAPRYVATQGWMSDNGAVRLLAADGLLFALMRNGLQVLPLHAPGY